MRHTNAQSPGLSERPGLRFHYCAIFARSARNRSSPTSVKGLRIIRANAISEVLGDKEAKAVKLKGGKVFASEIILFMETDEDLRLFSGLLTRVGQKIDVDADFKATGVDGLFIVDQPCSASNAEISDRIFRKNSETSPPAAKTRY